MGDGHAMIREEAGVKAGLDNDRHHAMNAESSFSSFLSAAAVSHKMRVGPRQVMLTLIPAVLGQTPRHP